MTRSWATIGYELLKNAPTLDLSQSHLELLSRGIKNAIKRIPSEEGEYQDWIADDVADYIEESLGIAFVISQRAITSIISRAEHIPTKFRTGQTERLIRDESGKFRKVLLSLGNKDFGQPKYSAVSCIIAFGNYYKHSSEWSYDWDRENLKPIQFENAEIVTALAGDPARSSGVFRAAARGLGCGESYDLQFVIEHLKCWHQEVMKLFMVNEI